ncbi:hypothetical protein [Solitalea koreensis]|uniref:Uncharacterized protein n=1 Tax=Solitalea koreensis TaxID=543615 RepID=A0A521BNQ1_9SPHI|nr:hypothetical protein [Solitalea koreensis]SMO48230.1 hypothetical protein SAMN06265350_102334 [Solitalea koreensis]
MKTIYLKLLARLKELPQIKYIDRDKGQLEQYEGDRPPVAFPCILIKQSLPQCKNLTPKEQLCSAQITVRVAFDYTGDASSISGEARLQSALSYFDTVDAVLAKLQGWGDAEMNAWERTSQLEEDRRDNFSVLRITLKTGYRETISS